MGDYEGKITINADPDEVFRFLSTIDNVPAFVPWIKGIRLEAGGHVLAVAEENGRERELSGFFRPLSEERRIDWMSERVPYQGWLQVRGLGPGAELTVHIRMQHEPREHTQGTLENLMNTIRRLLEERGQSSRQGSA